MSPFGLGLIILPWRGSFAFPLAVPPRRVTSAVDWSSMFVPSSLAIPVVAFVKRSSTMAFALPAA